MSKEIWVNNETNRLNRRYDGVPFRDSQKKMVAKMLWEQKGEVPLEDLEQEAMFTAWSLSHVHDWRNSTRMKMKKLVQEEKLYNRMGVFGDDFYRPNDSFNRPVEEEVEGRLALEKLTSVLIDNQKKVIDGLFFEGRTLEDLAKEMGVTRERIRQLSQKAKRKMREYARSSGWIEPDRASGSQAEFTPSNGIDEDPEPVNKKIDPDEAPKRPPEGGRNTEVQVNHEKVIKWDGNRFLIWIKENAAFFRDRGSFMLSKEQMPDEISIGPSQIRLIEWLKENVVKAQEPVGILVGRANGRWETAGINPAGKDLKQLERAIINLDLDQNPALGLLCFPPEEKNKSWWQKIWDGTYQETHIPPSVYGNLTVKNLEIWPKSIFDEVIQISNRTLPVWLVTGPERTILVAGVQETRKFEFTFESIMRATPESEIMMKAITETWKPNDWERRDGRWQQDLRIVPKLGLVLYVADSGLTKFVKWRESAGK